MRFRMLISSVVAAVAALTTVAAVDRPAHAATTRTWNRLAQCESSGRWHINTGNGYYGGLQISPSTWAGYGGAVRHPAQPGHQERADPRGRADQAPSGLGCVAKLREAPGPALTRTRNGVPVRAPTSLTRTRRSSSHPTSVTTAPNSTPAITSLGKCAPT